MATFPFTAYSVEKTALGFVLQGFPVPIKFGEADNIGLIDDDDNIDVDPTDDGQRFTLDPTSESFPTEAVDSIEFIDVTVTETGASFSVAAVTPVNSALTYLIPLDEAGNTLEGILDGDPDLTGKEFTATRTPNPPSSVAYCFVGDTLIRTPSGERRVDELQIGDPVSVLGGGDAPVRWIGRQTVDLRLGPTERLLPVKVRAGALGEGVPNRDLVITRDHALLVCGVLANAGALVNGSSIVPLGRDADPVMTYYHIDTAQHHLVFANGTPAETLIDDVTARESFDNFSEYIELFGRTPCEVRELPYPRAMSRRQLPGRIGLLLISRAVALSPRLRGAA
ncbi:MAG: Hint domain-containing protein [Pseudomonadota bacterium]